jgi:hypothetical protein
MGSTLSITAPVEIKTNIDKLDVSSDIKSEIDPSFSVKMHNKLPSLQTTTTMVVISSIDDQPYTLPDASKCPGHIYKFINRTSEDKLINTLSSNNINYTSDTQYRLQSHKWASFASDGISSWWA